MVSQHLRDVKVSREHTNGVGYPAPVRISAEPSTVHNLNGTGVVPPGTSEWLSFDYDAFA